MLIPFWSLPLTRFVNTWRLRLYRLEKIVRLPLSFFSSQPTGRLLNRFARDTEAGKATAWIIILLLNFWCSFMLLLFLGSFSKVWEMLLWEFGPNESLQQIHWRLKYLSLARTATSHLDLVLVKLSLHSKIGLAASISVYWSIFVYIRLGEIRRDEESPMIRTQFIYKCNP